MPANVTVTKTETETVKLSVSRIWAGVIDERARKRDRTGEKRERERNLRKIA
jgi:hypothetical protein